MYSNGYIPGIKASILPHSGPQIMWERGGFFIDHRFTVHKDLQILVDNCRKYDKKILLFTRHGTIRNDVFWTASAGELFWKQCLDLDTSGPPHTWTNVVDKVYRQYMNDPRILVISEHQSNLFFT